MRKPVETTRPLDLGVHPPYDPGMTPEEPDTPSTPEPDEPETPEET